jgi:hypothetical protein
MDCEARNAHGKNGIITGTKPIQILAARIHPKNSDRASVTPQIEKCKSLHGLVNHS